MFTNMIYTLQTGREAMEERLAIVANSPQDLLSKLNTVKSGFPKDKTQLEKKSIYYGAVKQAENNPLMGIFTDDMTKMRIRDGAQKDHLQKLANLWIAGFDVPWKSLWEEKNMQPISLPSYPFYQTRYWAEVTGEVTPVALSITKKVEKTTDAKPTLQDATEKIAQEKFFYISEEEHKEHSLTAIEKMEALADAGVAVAKSPADIGSTLLKKIQKS